MATPKKKYPNIINVRVKKETKDWYNTQAGYRNMKLSGFIRAIPNIFFKLNSALDDKDNEILELKEKLKLK